jgi:hypothetical protein
MLISVFKAAQDLQHVATRQTTAAESESRHDAVVPDTPDQLLNKADKNSAQSLNFVEDLGWQEHM